MKILLTTDPEIPVPPNEYGGAERVAQNLLNGFNHRGHQVILVANQKSTSEFADKLIAWKSDSSVGYINIWRNAWQLLAIIRKEKPDVVLCFSRIMYLYPAWLFSDRRFIKRYGRYISPNSNALANFIIGKRIHYTPNAVHMIDHLSKKHKYTVIFSGVDTEYFYCDQSARPDYLLFLGRIEYIKGTKEAIEAALHANKKIIIAGNFHKEHEAYFNSYVKPHLKNPLIEYVGPVNNGKKRELLQGAIALLQPFNLLKEAFPSTVIESLACGTPVIGFQIPALNESIINGRNGFVVKDVEGMVKAIERIRILDRKDIRRDAVHRFSIQKTTDDYLRLIEQINKN